MPSLMEFPRLDVVLPCLHEFIRGLAAKIKISEVRSRDEAGRLIAAFLTRDQLAQIELVAPGVVELYAFDDGQTLAHVIIAMTSLAGFEEYRDASCRDKTIISWALLFHDIAKRATKERDHLHAYHSSVVAARSLPTTGCTLPSGYAEHIDTWSTLTASARKFQESDGSWIQDNAPLGEILSGLDRMLSHNSSANLIIKLVLLHHSFNTLSDWPQRAALSDSEISSLIDARLLGLMKVVLLADNDGWELFNKPNSNRYRRETRKIFVHYGSLVSVKSYSDSADA